ncbi:unnamed protein product [Symbiodinium natans]|uniref:Uncharacterized protein n=1 Tax=Symbiodinium natans TaxID=878477 RepID=A0A812GEG7_9DINO|nr:unnamed protein product [Symbiodinium natans]
MSLLPQLHAVREAVHWFVHWFDRATRGTPGVRARMFLKAVRRHRDAGFNVRRNPGTGVRIAVPNRYSDEGDFHGYHGTSSLHWHVEAESLAEADEALTQKPARTMHLSLGRRMPGSEDAVLDRVTKLSMASAT